MATQTLAEAAKLINDDLVTGIAEEIMTTNPMFDMIPVIPFEGQALVVNYEVTLGDADFYGVGDTITSKGALTTAARTYQPTKVIGDVELDKLVQATSSGAGVNQLALEIASKSKSVGRLIQGGLATGTGTLPSMYSMRSMTTATQTIFADGTGASAGAALTFELLDQLLALVKAKDGVVDFIAMSKQQHTNYKALVRASGGNTTEHMVLLPTTQNVQRSVISYEGIPIFVNDYLDITEGNDGTGVGVFDSIYAGTFDDGTKKIGFGLIVPAATGSGIMTENIGLSSTKDEDNFRIKFYGNGFLGNSLGLARLAALTA